MKDPALDFNMNNKRFYCDMKGKCAHRFNDKLQFSQLLSNCRNFTENQNTSDFCLYKNVPSSCELAQFEHLNLNDSNITNHCICKVCFMENNFSGSSNPPLLLISSSPSFIENKFLSCDKCCLIEGSEKVSSMNPSNDYTSQKCSCCMDCTSSVLCLCGNTMNLMNTMNKNKLHEQPQNMNLTSQAKESTERVSAKKFDDSQVASELDSNQKMLDLMEDLCFIDSGCDEKFCFDDNECFDDNDCDDNYCFDEKYIFDDDECLDEYNDLDVYSSEGSLLDCEDHMKYIADEEDSLSLQDAILSEVFIELPKELCNPPDSLAVSHSCQSSAAVSVAVSSARSPVRFFKSVMRCLAAQVK